MNLVAAVLALLDRRPLLERVLAHEAEHPDAIAWPLPGSPPHPPREPVRSNDGEPLHDL